MQGASCHKGIQYGGRDLNIVVFSCHAVDVFNIYAASNPEPCYLSFGDSSLLTHEVHAGQHSHVHTTVSNGMNAEKKKGHSTWIQSLKASDAIAVIPAALYPE